MEEYVVVQDLGNVFCGRQPMERQKKKKTMRAHARPSRFSASPLKPSLSVAACRKRRVWVRPHMTIDSGEWWWGGDNGGGLLVSSKRDSDPVGGQVK